ncbi:unnamed protein product [Rhizophagus irregularis]|nr:unnamed protein product [Rhizophagus irregularis]
MCTDEIYKNHCDYGTPPPHPNFGMGNSLKVPSSNQSSTASAKEITVSQIAEMSPEILLNEFSIEITGCRLNLIKAAKNLYHNIFLLYSFCSINKIIWQFIK